MPTLCVDGCAVWVQAMWGFARMEYRPPNLLLDAVLKVRLSQGRQLEGA